MITLIAAVARNGVIGKDGGLPWRLPDDMRHFKQRTMGHSVIVGRKTWNELGKALPGRRWLVLSRDPSFTAPGATVVRTLDDAMELARGEPEVFVAGGAEIYAMALPVADRLDLTEVDADVEGDTVFPPVDLSEWRMVRDEHHPADDRHAHSFRIRRYERP